MCVVYPRASGDNILVTRQKDKETQKKTENRKKNTKLNPVSV